MQKDNLLYLIIVFAHFGCQSQFNVDKVLSASNRIVFVEARSASNGVFAPDYGDVWLMDFDSKESIQITNDGFFDEKPRITPRSRDVAFISAREDSPGRLRIAGLGATRSIYVYEGNTHRLRRLSGTSGVESFDWLPDGKSLVFSRRTDTLFQVNLQNDSISKYAIYANLGTIHDATVSPNGKFLGITFQRTKSTGGIAIWDIGQGSLSVIYDSIPQWPSTQVISWSSNDSILYFTAGQLKEFDVASFHTHSFNHLQSHGPRPGAYFQIIDADTDMIYLDSQSIYSDKYLYFYNAKKDKVEELRGGKAVEYPMFCRNLLGRGFWVNYDQVPSSLQIFDRQPRCSVRS